MEKNLQVVVAEALKTLGMNPEEFSCLGSRTFVNSAKMSRMRDTVCYGCYYVDESYDWALDNAITGCGFDLVDQAELRDGSALNVNSEDAVSNDYDGLVNFNRKKFRMFMEKLCDAVERKKLYVNVQFAVPEGSEKSEIVFLQFVDSVLDCWTL